MVTENNNGLTFSEEVLIVARRDGQIVYIEEQPNGHIIRHITEVASKSQSADLLGVNRLK